MNLVLDDLEAELIILTLLAVKQRYYFEFTRYIPTHLLNETLTKLIAEQVIQLNIRTGIYDV